MNVRSIGIVNANGISSLSSLDKRAAFSSILGTVKSFIDATRAFPTESADCFAINAPCLLFPQEIHSKEDVLRVVAEGVEFYFL